MIRSVIVTNSIGENLVMGIGDPDESGLLISNIEGIGPGQADISVTELAAADGAVYNSSRLVSRNITFTILFQDNMSIEDKRHLSYQFFHLKKPLTLTFITDTRTLQIDGYVESNEPDIFNEAESTVISIICPNPYFYDLISDEILFSAIEPMFEFPFCNDSLTEKLLIFSEIRSMYENVVYYEGDADTGVVITVHFLGNASDISIFNIVRRETMTIDTTKLAAIVGSEIQAGDDLVISTISGKKSLTFWRNGKSYNVLNALTRSSDWLNIGVGRNALTFTAKTGERNIKFDIVYHPLYEGV